MKQLLIVLFGFSLGTFIFPSMNSLNYSENQELISCYIDQPGQLTLGDGEQALEQEIEKEVFLNTVHFVGHILHRKNIRTPKYKAFYSLGKRISPHLYTDLPPPASYTYSLFQI